MLTVFVTGEAFGVDKVHIAAMPETTQHALMPAGLALVGAPVRRCRRVRGNSCSHRSSDVARRRHLRARPQTRSGPAVACRARLDWSSSQRRIASAATRRSISAIIFLVSALPIPP